MKTLRLISTILVLGLVLGSTAFADRLADIKARDSLVCGVNNELPGFGSVNSAGQFEGFDIDFCKAIAAAILGDATKVDYRPLTSNNRLTAVQSGQVDVLIRNTTFTSSRDTSAGLEFMPITFFDGQGFMVRKDSGITTLQDLDGRNICLQSGSTTERNLNDVFSALHITFTAVIFENAQQVAPAYEQGVCEAWTTDKSALAGHRTALRNPSDHILLEATISKSPLAPAVRNGEAALADAIKWVIYGLFAAEEYGITSANVEDLAANSINPSIRTILGEGDNVANIGLRADGILQAVKAVGNYGEIYERNLGPNTPFNIPRGQNSQYTVPGGLLYAPPFL